MVQAVLFDVDGVLVHRWRFRSALARDHGITPNMTAPFFKGPFVRCVEGHRAVAHRLGRSGTELLFIDDAPANVEGARAAGWLAEQFRTAEGLRADVARYTGYSAALRSVPETVLDAT